ncbi:hypothetical protein F5X99DRAFT_408531 [Biscogniauxia marginata]|nr:hypothetical protein F5X99DRAFT_408531 [Biscogniauxia marginata]
MERRDQEEPASGPRKNRAIGLEERQESSSGAPVPGCEALALYSPRAQDERISSWAVTEQLLRQYNPIEGILPKACRGVCMEQKVEVARALGDGKRGLWVSNKEASPDSQREAQVGIEGPSNGSLGIPGAFESDFASQGALAGETVADKSRVRTVLVSDGPDLPGVNVVVAAVRSPRAVDITLPPSSSRSSNSSGNSSRS